MQSRGSGKEVVEVIKRILLGMVYLVRTHEKWAPIGLKRVPHRVRNRHANVFTIIVRGTASQGERDVLEDMGTTDECDMEKFGTPDSSEATIAIQIHTYLAHGGHRRRIRNYIRRDVICI